MLFATGAFAIVLALGAPGQVHAQNSRGGMHPGMHHGMHRGIRPGLTPGFRGPMIDRPFVPRNFDRFEDRLERRFPFGRFDRLEDLLENRRRMGFLPDFVDGFMPGFPILIPFGFLGQFPIGF
jgi:hypothetical protein